MAQYAIHLCGGPESPSQIRNPDCPSAAEHTLEPVGYLGWHDWAARMSKTHTQTQCPDCGLWCVWRPKGLRGLAVERTET